MQEVMIKSFPNGEWLWGKPIFIREDIKARELGLAMEHLGFQPSPSSIESGVYDPMKVESIKEELQKGNYGEFEED